MLSTAQTYLYQAIQLRPFYLCAFPDIAPAEQTHIHKKTKLLNSKISLFRKLSTSIFYINWNYDSRARIIPVLSYQLFVSLIFSFLKRKKILTVFFYLFLSRLENQLL